MHEPMLRMTVYKSLAPILTSQSVFSMGEFDRKVCILILTFWIFVPTLDMISDMTMVIRLFRGPDPDLVLSGGRVLKFGK